MTGIISLVVISVVILFSINLAKAKHVYEENIIAETDFFDADADDGKLFFAYTSGHTIILERKTFGGGTLDERELVSESPHKIDLLVKDGVPYITWISSNNQINAYDGENILFISEGATPRLYSIGENVYLAWIRDKTLYTRPLSNPAEWIIASMISDYSIYEFNEKIYFTYTKDSNVCFRSVSMGVWTSEKTISPGQIPHFIRNDATSYIYHIDDHGKLECFYGSNDDIKLTALITTDDVYEIITYKDILAFTTAEGLFMQRITNEGFSDMLKITGNPATKINVFYADDDDLMFTYIIESRAISKFVALPVSVEESVKPLTFEIFGGDDVAKKNAFDYIADYNLRNVAPEGEVMNFILAHSGESLAFLGVVIIAIVVAVTVLAGKRRDQKNVRK